jgi:hypothetical protein
MSAQLTPAPPLSTVGSRPASVNPSVAKVVFSAKLTLQTQVLRSDAPSLEGLAIFLERLKLDV